MDARNHNNSLRQQQQFHQQSSAVQQPFRFKQQQHLSYQQQFNNNNNNQQHETVFNNSDSTVVEHQQPDDSSSDVIPRKQQLYPIRQDFWARRTAQRASEAIRAAQSMALGPTAPLVHHQTTGQLAHHQTIGPLTHHQKTGPLAHYQTTANPPAHQVTANPLTHQQTPGLPPLVAPHTSAPPQPHMTPQGAAVRAPVQRSSSSSNRSPTERRRRRRRGGGVSPSDGAGDGDDGSPPSLPTNFRAALAQYPPGLPPQLLRKLDIKEVNGLGKIRVVLRVSPLVRLLENESSVLSLDKKRRQVTLNDPLAPAPKDSRFGVAAPKMFAFDQVYSQDDSQTDVVSGAAVDILHAVMAGNDGCIICFGGSLLGKSFTMVGLHGSQDQLGVMPSSISWLYKSIAEQKNKTGARFSVRVSAVAVDATGANIKDLLAHCSSDAPQNHSVLPESGILSSLIELRAPSLDTASHYLDVALAGRSSLALSSVLQRQQQSSGSIFPGSATLIYTLHLYQYTVDKSGKGGVVGGRSKLHLVDMGDMSARHGNSSMSLSSLTSVLLAIFNGQKYLPHRDNRLTGVLKEALQSLTCHTSLVVHVSPASRHAQHTLTTLQLAARVHRTRRKKIRGLGSGGSSGSSGSRRSSGSETSAGSSSIDFSSSEQSCDTVIYIGGGGPGDSTDGEHPPIFMPHHLRQPRALGLQRLRSFEQLRAQSASPTPHNRRPASASPTPTSRSVPNGKPFQKRKPCPPPRTVSNNTLMICSASNSPRTTPLQAGFIRHQPGVSQIIYPDHANPLHQQPFMSTFKPLASQAASRENNNIQQRSLEDNLNVVNGNQVGMPTSNSTEMLHNYSAYQEPNNLVPTALSPNQNMTNVQNIRYFQLSQQQFQQQKLFQQHSLKEQQRVLEQQKLFKSQDQKIKIHQRSQQKPEAQNIESKALLDSKSDEQWIDGPRVHKSRVSVNRANKNEHDETWVDGPQVSTQSNGTQISAQTSGGQGGTAYGFMDDHKKSMIEKWVEVQTLQVVSQIGEKVVTVKENNNSTKPKNSESSATKNIGLNNKNAATRELTHLTQFRTCDESTNGSDVDTLSEDPSGSGVATVEQPSLIEELERKNLIPVGGAKLLEGSMKDEPSLDHIQVSSADETKMVSDCSTKGRGSPETTSLVGELSIDEVCSQCEALAEECEELSSLLSCEEEECKRQIHQGLATVMEEPELESAVAAEDAAQMRRQEQVTDQETDDCASKMDTLRSSRAGGEDGNEADEESSEIGQRRRRCVKRTCTSSSTHDKDSRKGRHQMSMLRSPQEMIEVDLPAYPVVSVDCGTQVCESDLNGSIINTNACNSDDHPLRVLSEENLTCASNFTDCCSQAGETGDEEDLEEDINRPLSLFEATDYSKVVENLSLATSSDDCNLRELVKMHALYRSLAEQGAQPHDVQPQLQPSSLMEILSTSRDSLVEAQKAEAEYESICSDLIASINKEQDANSANCSSCSKPKFGTRNIENYRLQNSSNVVPDDYCACDNNTEDALPPYVPSSLYVTSSVTKTSSNHLTASDSSLIKISSEINYNLSDYTLENNEDGSSMNDRVPANGVSIPEFIEDVDANVILCNPGQYNFNSGNHVDPSLERCSNDDSDCMSNVSEDSEYVMRTSKLSKFLCVGVGRSKSKTPYKLSKQNFKADSKKNVKMKETKSKSSSKSRESSKSPDFSSKNLLKSPSRVNSQNLSNSSSSSSSVSRGDSSYGINNGGIKNNRWCKFGSSKASSNYSTNSSFSYQAAPGEGYDSGHESGLTQGSTTPQEVSENWVMPLEKKNKVEGQRIVIPAMKSGTNSSMRTTPSLGDSSGYGSMARDSECSSFSSSQDSEMDEEHRREITKLKSISAQPPMKVEKFTEEDILRYEGRTRNLDCLNDQKLNLQLKLQKDSRSKLAEVSRDICVTTKAWP